MKICKVLMPIGNLGIGINKEAFDKGMAMKPDVIAIDAGSTDSGPAYLANGMAKYSRHMLKNDLSISVIGSRKANIPLLIGSCGTCGTNYTVDLFAEIVQEILEEEKLTAKIAKVYSQQNPEVLKKKWDKGKIHPLEGAPDITRDTFDECSNIVALMGAEPFIETIKGGANIVLCGRTTDTAIIAAMPIIMGCNEAAAWHGAKTVECGSMCTDKPMSGGVFLIVDENGFYVSPLDADAHCTPYTVSAHLLYENVDPYHLTEPSGTIVTNDSVYTQYDYQTVYVKNTRFEHAKKYTMKLEGARVVGYQNVSLVGMADPAVMKDPQKWINNISSFVDGYIKKAGYTYDDYSFNFKAYGYNAVIDAPVPDGAPAPREIGMLLTVTAKTQEIADQIAKIFNPYLLHFPADIKKQIPSFAFPFSPVDFSRGRTYEFMLHHVVELEDPLELVKIEYIDK